MSEILASSAGLSESMYKLKADDKATFYSPEDIGAPELVY